MPRYAVDELREHSRILEPTARIDANAPMVRQPDRAPASAATRLEAIPVDRLNDEVATILAAELDREGRPYLVDAVTAALERAFELSEAGIGAAFDKLPAALDAARDAPPSLARLIGRGFAAAALWDRIDVARDLATRFLQLAGGRAGWNHAEDLTNQAFRCLRRLGLKADADRVLHHVAERVLQGQPLERFRASRQADWPAALRVLLHAAAGWYYAGKEKDEQAHAILNEARRDLFAPSTTPADRTELAVTYAATLGQAPVLVALGRLEEIFRDLKGIKVTGSTNQYYSLQPLRLIETAVRAVVSEDFAVGPQVRAWLDADELIVRRRIRDELKEILAGQGF
jgi:hypothetical protein